VAAASAAPSQAACPAVNGIVTLPSGNSMIVRAPATTHPRSAVVVLHGFTGSPAYAEVDSRLTPDALGHGVLVAYPQGTPLPSGGYGWNSGAGIYATTTGDDIAALTNIIDLLTGSYCVEPGRVVLSGESNGAGMVVHAACTIAINERVAALVAVIPAVDSGVIAPCTQRGLRPLPLLAVAAIDDPIVPYAGQSPLLGQADWFSSVARQLDQCASVAADPSDQEPRPGLVGQGCAAAAALVAVPSDEHRWPHVDVGFDTNAAVLAVAAAAA
jgi:polyhydroxybutyrate depolymerase